MFVADAAFYIEALVVAEVAAVVVVTAVAAGTAHDFSMSSFVKGTSTLGCLRKSRGTASAVILRVSLYIVCCSPYLFAIIHSLARSLSLPLYFSKPQQETNYSFSKLK